MPKPSDSPSKTSSSVSTADVAADTSSSTASPSGLLPTRREAILLLTYPATLFLGSLFSLLNPSARVAPYSATTQSHPAAQAPAYFAKKSNILNLYFVKVAWFWVTLAFFVFLFSTASMTAIPGSKATPAGTLTPKRLRAIGRYSLVTFWWVVVTQWCFGPALIDRGFRLSGGVCELANALEGSGSKEELFTSQACKSIGGVWKGGHDISGHVFILVLGSAFLILEMLPVWKGWKEGESVEGGRADTEEQSGDDESFGKWPLAVVVGLSFWMLLMTAAYFHTWFEKLTGLLVAFFGVFVVYILPRAVPRLESVLGAPGV